MSSELTRYAQRSLVSSDTSLGKEAGSGLMKVAGGGMVLGLAAWLIPFVSLTMLLPVVFVLGVILWLKS